MELIERDDFIAALQQKFTGAATEGHCIFLSGEPGIGKTSLVREFCNEIKSSCKIYQGACDALFAPRPLAALYDIALQTGIALPKDQSDRTALFTRFSQQLEMENETVLMVIEDIHWADEATLDFIKYLARRITQLNCLAIFTYRDNEVHGRHPLTNVLGQLPTHAFSRMVLTPLSKDAVNKLAEEKGYKGEDVYRVTCGNPFYVSEILASYHSGIPVNIRDSILSAYNRLDERAKNVWEILSVLPTGFEVKYLETMDANYLGAIHFCLEYRILVMHDGMISFKHELFRRTIETSLSPFLRVALNKKILELFGESFERNGEIERIIHHAKNANDYETVVHYAPLAAKKAAALGAHLEASKLYFSAIEYYQENDAATLINFYDAYAYECYLTSQIKEAIIYATKSFELSNDIEKKGDCMRFLSRLWWLDGNKKKAQAYALRAVNLFADQPISEAKAMAFSNMSHLAMLADEVEQCIGWGKKAIAMAKELNSENVLCHSLNNIGTALARTSSFNKKGMRFLQQSLQLALKNNQEENIARAYTNIGSSALSVKDYENARAALDAGIKHAEERDLGFWTTLMLSNLSRLHAETGNYTEAYRIAENCKPATLEVLAKIKMRRGDEDAEQLLLEAKSMAVDVMELRTSLPIFTTLLEYEWLTGNVMIETPVLQQIITMVQSKGQLHENSAFAYWFFKARNRRMLLKQSFEGYQNSVKAAQIWKQLGCPYEQALALFEGNEADKRKAIDMIDRAGDTAVFEKMKFLMRRSGIRQIPRGIRKTTRANTANLTERELDILLLLQEGLQNKEIACKLFISPKTVDHHMSSIFFKLDVNSRLKAVEEAVSLNILK